MRITIVAVGRAKPGPARALYEFYAQRLSERAPGPHALGPLTLKEVEERRPLPPDKRRAAEGELLLAGLPNRAPVVALDEGGKTLTSTGFAERLGRWRDDGVGDLGFVIGGDQGLSEAVKARAILVLSLGPMTWPHLLVRGLLAEQLYRAGTLLAGHPYHRA